MDVGRGRGRVAPPVLFIMKTGFGVASCGGAPKPPGGTPALPEVVARGRDSGTWWATRVEGDECETGCETGCKTGCCETRGAPAGVGLGGSGVGSAVWLGAAGVTPPNGRTAAESAIATRVSFPGIWISRRDQDAATAR